MKAQPKPKQTSISEQSTEARLREVMSKRIVILDGAYGSAFQGYEMEEEEFRGERFSEHSMSLKGNHDILNLTRQYVVEEVHRGYLEAGCDIICTNTFNATSIAQADFGTEDICREMNKESPKSPGRLLTNSQPPKNHDLSPAVLAQPTEPPAFRQT